MTGLDDLSRFNRPFASPADERKAGDFYATVGIALGAVALFAFAGFVWSLVQ